MVQRNDRGMFGNLMVFPGGVVDETDSDRRHTALRELREETGIDAGSPAGLVLISRWVTPAIAPQRFDTIFYLVEAPEGVEAAVDGVELVAHAWATPAEALGLASHGTWAMILPTMSHLRWLSRRTSIEDAFSAARGTDGETVVEPSRLEDGTLLPLYRSAEER